jgi:cytochrome c553
MAKHRFVFLTAFFGVLVFSASLAMSQADMKTVPAEAFAQRSRPAAVFVHDAHNEKAAIETCGVCHHGKDDKGRKDVEATSEGTPCAECHAVDAKSGTPLMRAYHRQCINCHLEKKQGPTYCGGCHTL